MFMKENPDKVASFPIVHMVTIIVNMVENNTFSFNKCNFGIKSGFQKKTQNFSNFVKGNTFSKFEFITLRVEKALCMTSIPS